MFSVIAFRVISLYILYKKCLISHYVQGRIQEFWLGGGGIFSPKACGPGTALRPSVGPWQSPGGDPGDEAPRGPEF